MQPNSRVDDTGRPPKLSLENWQERKRTLF